jgi:GTPase SAR1 family protein
MSLKMVYDNNHHPIVVCYKQRMKVSSVFQKYGSDNIQVLLVGNKADLEHARKVTSQEAETLAGRA